MSLLKKIIILAILTFISLTGCVSGTEGNVKGEVDLHGYVLDKADDSIFVVSKEAKDLSANGGIETYYDAISLSDAPNNVQIGDEVMVWYAGGVAESYPMQGKVGHLEIMPDTKPEGANFTQAEALRKSLQDQQNVLVTSINFKKSKGLWLVKFRDLHEDNEWQIEVNDSES